jgi:hypothetical protein
MLGELAAIIESDRFADVLSQSPEYVHDDSSGFEGSFAVQLSGDDEAAFAFLEHQHGAGALAYHQISLPVIRGFASVHVFRTVMDGATTGNGVTRPASRATASFSPLPRQEFPWLLWLLCRAVQPIIDGLEADQGQVFVAGLKPAGNLLWRPTLVKSLADKVASAGSASRIR